MNFDIYNHTILLSRSGSRLYGISTPESDIDVQGCAIPPLPYWMSNLTFEQVQGSSYLEDSRFTALFSEEEKQTIANTKCEGSIYNVSKYLKMAADSNPNVLDSLFSPDSAILLSTKTGDLLRENRGLFVSLAAYSRFVGYSTSQLEKMNLHRTYLTNPRLTPPTRAEFGLLSESVASEAELTEIKAAIQKQIDQWGGAFSNGMSQTDIWMVKEYFTQALEEMQLSALDRYELAEKRLGVPMKIREYLSKEREYAKALGEYKSYQRWLKDRNPVRAATEAKAGYDTKFAVHLIRLLRCSVELLKTGIYNVDRRGIDSDLLMEIRAGKLKYEDIMSMSDALKIEAKAAYDANSANLPARPQTEAVNALLLKIVADHFGVPDAVRTS